MNFCRSLFALALAAGLLLAPAGHAAPAAAQNLSKADVEAIVKQYIAQHGDELVIAIRTAQTKQQVEAAKKIVQPFNPVMGPASAPVTIIEFVDFECPYCARAHPTIVELRKRYGTKIHWVAKHLPLPFHAKAMGAAQAAQAAASQGKYWEFSELLWAKQEFLSDALYDDLAKQLKLNVKKFDADRASPLVKTEIQTDMRDADSVGAHGTPFFLINGNPVSGAMPVEAFTGVIDAILAGKPVPQLPQ